jgi:beta-glucosidase
MSDVGRDINDLVLPRGQADYVRNIAKIGTPPIPQSHLVHLAVSLASLTSSPPLSRTGTPVVLVLVEGRPRILWNLKGYASAVIDTMLPGPAGGQALAEVLSGAVNPSGRLPFTYPKYTGGSDARVEPACAVACGREIVVWPRDSS